MKDRASIYVINSQEVHLWIAPLALSVPQVEKLLALLSPDEVSRAERYRFDLHRYHYIASRGMLRQLLAAYLNCDAKRIQFLYNEHGKPYIANIDLQFNVSHSHDMAVYALTSQLQVGVDIEKIENTFKDGVAKRYFSAAEYRYLQAVPEDERIKKFYWIWSRKEAFIKALGMGLHYPLSSFSVVESNPMMLKLQDNTSWYLESFEAHADYQAAFVTEKKVERIIRRAWIEFSDGT